MIAPLVRTLNFMSICKHGTVKHRRKVLTFKRGVISNENYVYKTVQVFEAQAIATKKSKPARQYCWWKMTFLQIRNNSKRCWKAQEYLIFKWKCIPEWLFSDNHVAGPGTKQGVYWVGRRLKTTKRRHNNDAK